MVSLDVVKNIPPAEEWTRMMENSPPEEALRLWRLANECLYTTNNQDQRWGGHIGIAERVLRERGIDPHAAR